MIVNVILRVKVFYFALKTFPQNVLSFYIMLTFNKSGNNERKLSRNVKPHSIQYSSRYDENIFFRY